MVEHCAQVGFRPSQRSFGGVHAQHWCDHVLFSAGFLHRVRDACAIRHILGMLGHEHLQTTAGYTHVAIEKRVEAYERTHPRAQRPSTPAKSESTSTESA
jgi:integrase/recombinase XerC